MTNDNWLSNIKKTIAKSMSINDDIYICNTQYELYNLIIFSMIKAFSLVVKTPYILCSNIEHPYIIEILDKYEKAGMVLLSYINADINGYIQPIEVEKHINSKNGSICLVIISLLNYMIGSKNDIKSISELVHKHKIPLFSDCIYSYGRTIPNQFDLIDLYTICINNIYTLIIKKELLTGYKLYMYHPLFQNNDKMVNLNYDKHTLSQYFKDTSYPKIINLDKRVLALNKLLLNLIKKKNNVIYYEDIVKNNIIPKDNDIVLFGDNKAIPNIMSFMYNDLTKIKKLKKQNIVVNTDTRLFENIGIKKKFINKIITILLDNATKSDITDFVKLF